MFNKLNILTKLITLLTILFFSACKSDEFARIEGVPEYYFVDDYLDYRIKEINKAISQCSDGCETFFG